MNWYEYALRFLDEFKKGVQAKDGKKKGTGKFNLDRAQIFACLHFDAKSGIPHLHIIINRIDLDGNYETYCQQEEKLYEKHRVNISAPFLASYFWR